MKKIIVLLIFAVIVWAILACSGEDKPESGLSTWVGVYTFEEVDIDTPLFYEITIYEENGEFLAIITIDSRIYPISLEFPFRANIFGNEEWISLTLIEPTGIITTGCRVDDVLISFRREGGNIYTYWGTLFSSVPENIESNGRYFEKVADGIERADISLPRADLSSWVGTYTFKEAVTRWWGDMAKHYEIVIYEENGDYFARIFTERYVFTEGEPPESEVIEAYAKVFGGEEWISLTVIEFLVDGLPFYPPQIDRVIMSFRRENNNIYTYWGMIRSIVWEEHNSNMVLFEKVQD